MLDSEPYSLCLLKQEGQMKRRHALPIQRDEAGAVLEHERRNLL